MRYWFGGLVLLLLGSVMAQESAQNVMAYNIGIDDAWGRWESDTELALYMRLSSERADRLIGLGSLLAGRAELHTHVVTSGIAQMRAVSGIDLPAGIKIRLEPGGLHGMLLDVQQPAGRLIPVTLRFLNAGEISLRVEIRE